MKGFIAAIIVLIILGFTFTTLPSDFARLIKGYIDIEAITKERIIKPVIDKILENKNAEEARLELLEKAGVSLSMIGEELKNETSPAKKKEALQKLVQETEGALEEIKNNNSDPGFIREIAKKIVANILSSQEICEEKSSGE